MTGQHATDQGVAQIGPHRLRAADPVIAAGAFHGVEALINHDRDRLIMVGHDFLATGVVAVVAPFRTAGDAHGIRAEPVGGCLDQRGVALGIIVASLLFARRVAVLDQRQRRHHPPLRPRGRGLPNELAVGRRLLDVGTEIPELGSREHVCALGHPCHAWLVDEGCRLINPAQGLKRMLAVDEIAILEPRCLHREGLRRIERTVGLEREIGRNHGQPHALRAQWAVRLAVAGDGNAGLDRKPVEANLAAGHAVAACFMAQQAQIVGQYAGAFVGTERAALRLCIADPFAARLVRPGVTRMGKGDDQRVAVLINAGHLEVHAGLEVGHDYVHACGEGLGLFGAQPVGEVVDLGVAVGL